MKKLFMDSDVILDFLLDREPFNEDLGVLFQHSAQKKIKLCTSSVSITNLHYIIGRLENKKNASIKTEKILKLIKIENVGESIIKAALTSKFKDFEDGVQHFCALESDHTIIITRNTKDYQESELAVMTPREYLAR